MNDVTTTNSKEAPWDYEISNKRKLIDLNFGELWRYRDLILLFVHRDLTSTYKQTVLGPVWFVVQPLISTGIYSIIFGQIAKIPTDGLPPFLFYMVGIVAWNYFSGCVTRCSGVFTGNSGIFAKVYFPRLCVPISSVISLTINCSLQFLMFICFLVFFMVRGNDVHPNWGMLLLPILTLDLALLGIGLGCLVSAMTTRYRDLQMALGFGMQLWMYASCVFYSRDVVEPQWRWFFSLNPVVPVIEALRGAFLGSGTINLVEIAGTFVLAVIIFLAGVIVFHRVEKDFADII